MTNEINKLETFINSNGNAMMRKCENCVFWNRMSASKDDTGYCVRQKIFFAYTLEQTRYFQTKFCDLCLEHQFKNEHQLSMVAEKTLLINVLKSKEEIKNNCSEPTKTENI